VQWNYSSVGYFETQRVLWNFYYLFDTCGVADARVRAIKETNTMAAECQVTKILIGPRNKIAGKRPEKKDSAVKIILPPFQFTSSDF
jgi:hypothetical protein